MEADFEKIKAFLKFEEEWVLELRNDWSEGFCNRNRKKIILGIHGGYNRTLLIHECLHAIGYNHNAINFSGSLTYDLVSPMYEKWIFYNS